MCNQPYILKLKLTRMQDSNTLRNTHTDNNAGGSFPLSLFLFDPAPSNIWYLCPIVWAKVNRVPSKTSHFPSHLLTTRGPKHTESPVPAPSPSCSRSDSGRGKFHVCSAKLQSAYKQHTATALLFRRPEPVTTLKCRIRLPFFIIHWFYVACAILCFFFFNHISQTSLNSSLQPDTTTWFAMFFYVSTPLPSRYSCKYNPLSFLRTEAKSTDGVLLKCPCKECLEAEGYKWIILETEMYRNLC